MSNDRYHCDQGEKGDPKRYEPNKGVEDGSGPQKQIVLKMIGITGIRANRGTPWGRSQISVLVGPLYSLFF